MDFENEQVRGGDLSQEQGELNIRELWHVFLENLWIIVLVTVTALIGAFVYIKISPVIYASNVVLMVNPSDTQVLNVAEVQKQDLGSIEMLNTVVQGLKNTDVIRLVMDEHKLYQDPRVIGKTTNKVTDF